MSEQNDSQAASRRRPSDKVRPYRRSSGLPVDIRRLRPKPEIDEKRQEYLSECHKASDTAPFKDIKLNRADVKWLLAKLNDERRYWLDLRGADLRGADLSRLSLVAATLRGAHLEGANLSGARLAGVDLSEVFFDAATRLNDIVLSNNDEYSIAQLADIHWGDVNVAVVDWLTISVLGDEVWSNLRVTLRRIRKGAPGSGDYEHRTVVRAYRQLSVVLRNQGLNEDAARFAYRAQLIQRKVLWHGRKFGQYFFSLFLDLLSGYGYKPLRSFIAYLIVIAAFATAYFIIGRTVGPALSPLGSVVFSMTSFHGRGFFPGGITLDDPLTVLAALEAFVGLLIEVTFIATLTQRLFGK